MPDTFNWQDENNNRPHGSFRSWFLIHLLTAGSDDGILAKEQVDELHKATDGLTNISVTFDVNGIKFDGDSFIDSFEEVIDREAERLASKKVSAIPRFDDLYDLMRDVESTVKEEVMKRVHAAGLEFINDDY